MRINDLVKIISTNELGVLVEIIKEEGFSDEYVVEISGEQFCCFKAELEVLDV
jgi:hypothetical protein